MPNTIGKQSQQPYWLRTPDYYAILHERQNHDEAVYAYGEYSLFYLCWGIDDFRANIVTRCPYCFDSSGIDQDIAEAYGQGALAKCEYCYGTTYWKADAIQLNGLKARIVRPCMWNTSDEVHKRHAQGDMTISSTPVQTTSDFRMRSGDFIVRADLTRWRVQPRKTDLIISGFQAADDVNTMIGYTYQDCKREDNSSVAFVLPPTDDATVQSTLNISTVPNYPVDFSAWEVINGDLIGGAFTRSP